MTRADAARFTKNTELHEAIILSDTLYMLLSFAHVDAGSALPF